MKKFYIILCSFLMLCGGYGCSSSKNAISNDTSILPDKAKYMVDNYFKDYHINYIISNGHGYVADLYDDIAICFDKKGEWVEISSRNVDIPGDVMPYGIVAYLHDNLPENNIESIKRIKSKGFIVTLNNGLNLKFNKIGQYVKAINDVY